MAGLVGVSWILLWATKQHKNPEAVNPLFPANSLTPFHSFNAAAGFGFASSGGALSSFP